MGFGFQLVRADSKDDRRRRQKKNREYSKATDMRYIADGVHTSPEMAPAGELYVEVMVMHRISRVVRRVRARTWRCVSVLVYVGSGEVSD